ncbi:MAG: 16S rRNA (uracil(1498)-N(3))-methyltransferase, partial [Chloroflexales bacterium]|nr:16S rRNA (uracil(1498)-N(3))-methyltransferase [Chloroflexales bacterium]
MSVRVKAVKNTLRFFVPPESLRGDEVHLADQGLAHQIGRVLRLGPGDQVLLLDGHGTACEVELTALGRDELRGRVTRRAPAEGEPALALDIFLPLIRPERFEWALQKCVELGAARLVPVAFARSLAADRADARKLDRWRRIVREAAEQACRGILPAVDAPLPFAAACAQAATADLALILCEGEAHFLGSIFKDPTAPAGERYKAIAPRGQFYREGKHDPTMTKEKYRELLTAMDLGGVSPEQRARAIETRQTVCASVSPDGIKWTNVEKPILDVG